jgi:predicted DNA-binding protein
MKEPSRFFNFQMPYKIYEQLQILSIRNDCSVAEIVRQAINLLLNKLNTNKMRNK